MDIYRIYAKDLEEDEVNYELAIHGCPVGGTLESRYRSLRLVLRQPEDEKVRLESSFTLENDFAIVPIKLKDIETQLETDDLKCFSRLVHYHKRIRRYIPETEEQGRTQGSLLDAIGRMTMKYYNIDIQQMAGEIPVMRIRKLQNTAPARLSQSEPMCPWREEAGGGDPDWNDPRDKDLISFVEGMKSLPEAQGTPKSPVECGTRTGAIPKRGGNRASFIPVQRTNEFPVEARRATVSGIPIAVPACEPLIPPPLVAEPVIPANKPQARNPFSPRYVQNQWETPEFKSNVPDNLEGQELLKIANLNFTQGEIPITIGRNPNNVANSQKPNMVEYVHASEIERYIKAYVNQMLTRPTVTSEQIVNNLVDQIANIGIRDAEVSQISGRIRDERQRSAHVEPPLPFGQFRYTASNNDDNLEARSPSVAQRNVHRGGELPLVNDPADHGYAPNYYPRRRLPHQTCNIIEKWPKFSGDSNPVPVVDFLRQIEILSRSYQVTSDELRMHAHLLFKDDAYVWFTAYEGQLHTWEALLSYLKMRYDNPNRDRFIREEMRNRKQRPNELFSAYLTDLEAMAQRMTRKMSPHEKLELVVENMKISYKRRLALEPVNSIEHLAQLCYRFDALEANLYPSRSAPRPAGLNAIGWDEVSDMEGEEGDEVSLLALQAKNFKRGITKTDMNTAKPSYSEDQLLCWNCRKSGHMWRECNWKKNIFCHICGSPDTIASKCPQNHNLKPREDPQPESKN